MKSMLRLPAMDTFQLPVTPSHAATVAGLALVQTIPGLRPEPKGILTAVIVGVYVLGETIFSSVKAKKVTLPEQVLALEQRVKELEA